MSLKRHLFQPWPFWYYDQNGLMVWSPYLPGQCQVCTLPRKALWHRSIRGRLNEPKLPLRSPTKDLQSHPLRKWWTQGIVYGKMEHGTSPPTGETLTPHASLLRGATTARLGSSQLTGPEQRQST